MKCMKRVLLSVAIFAILFLSFLSGTVVAQIGDTNKNQTDYTLTCGCPPELASTYNRKEGEQCVTDYDTFKKNPAVYHYWFEDPEITAQGKADERARQFIYWTINTSSIDNHPTLLSIWNVTRNMSYLFTLIIAVILGIGIIAGQRFNFSNKIQVWPQIWKILLMLLYITFSASVIILIIQLSEILMKFFIENLGGNKLFNIDFGSVSNENSYTQFIRGCRDLNLRVQEGVQAEVFLLKLTNITYYVMGTMLILRKVLLWFLLIVSPFLALLMPFVFIRNIGWIWIGVFFQWVFYGPLFALFLGALAKIWENGIPYVFDFSRINEKAGYVYPTAINIIYGGPAQKLAIMNNGNYVDTFAEYVITLIMLWAVTFFPWWLLRIFRDYCCDGIYAMKNILMSMYDQSRTPPGGPNPPGPTPSGIASNISTAIRMPKEVTIPVTVKLETVEEVKKASTETISKSMSFSASKITDVARYETNKTTRETVNKNLNYLKNPISAETPTERQKYINIRTELFNRAVKEDKVAKQILSSISTSTQEQAQRKEELLKSIPTQVPITHVVSVKVKMPEEKVKSVTSSFIRSASTDEQFIKTVAATTNIQEHDVRTTLQSLNQHIDKPANTVAQTISDETHIPKEKVTRVIEQFTVTAHTDKKLATTVAQTEKVEADQVDNVIRNTMPVIAEPKKHVEDTVTIPPSVSLEDYEQVKKMWTDQYEKGEVPVSDNITNREDWVDTDIVFITNTLNKIMSTDEKLRQQGLDEVGYILPIFLINNLKGDELTVYLKAKLEAAKAVKEEKIKEKEIIEKIKEKEGEELVDVNVPKPTEAQKVMQMSEELKQELPDEKKEKEEKKPVTSTPLKILEQKKEEPSSSNPK